MHWEDDGIVLALRPHGETSQVVELLTRAHGRHLGLVRGGRSMRGSLQPGNTLRANWRGRLPEHLGTFALEPLKARMGLILERADALAALRAETALTSSVLPERDPHPELFEAFGVLLDAFDHAHVWPLLLVRYELGLLEALGFGLDLTRCAVTGARDELIYVSPVSGRAVSADGAGDYAPRLLRLPPFLVSGRAEGAQPSDIADGLALTAHFFEQRVFAPHHKTLPPARIALNDHIGAKAPSMLRQSPI